MSLLADITQAGVTVKLKDQDITLSPLTMRSLGDFERWVQLKPYNTLREAGFATESQLQTCLAECLRHVVTADEADQHGLTIGGKIYLLYLSAKVKQPDLSATFFDDLPFFELDRALAQVRSISGIGITAGDEPTTEGKSKNAPAPNQRKVRGGSPSPS